VAEPIVAEPVVEPAAQPRPPSKAGDESAGEPGPADLHVTADQAESWRPPAWAPWVALAAAVAAAGAGTFMGLRTLDEGASIDSRQSAATTSTISFVFAGAAGAAAGALWFWRWKGDPQ
jgi:hypothetical protein